MEIKNGTFLSSLIVILLEESDDQYKQIKPTFDKHGWAFKHDKNILSVYGYQEEILVKEGQSVIAGESIGTMGMTGTDSVKLHFEIRDNGKSIDPVLFLNSKLN